MENAAGCQDLTGGGISRRPHGGRKFKKRKKKEGTQVAGWPEPALPAQQGAELPPWYCLQQLWLPPSCVATSPQNTGRVGTGIPWSPTSPAAMTLGGRQASRSAPGWAPPLGLEGACKGHLAPNKPSEAAAKPSERCQLPCPLPTVLRRTTCRGGEVGGGAQNPQPFPGAPSTPRPLAAMALGGHRAPTASVSSAGKCGTLGGTGPPSLQFG